MSQLTLAYSTAPENLVQVIERQRETLNAAQDSLKEFQEQQLALHSLNLTARAESLDSVRLVVSDEGERAVQDLRTIAGTLQKEYGVVAILMTRAGGKLGLVVSCAPETGVNAGTLIRALLTDFGGRGGGDARLAQGGGAASDEQIRALLANAKSRVESLRNG